MRDRRGLLMYSPVALALLLVLPRLLSAHFGLFDDGVTLRVAGELAHGDWSVLSAEAATGRFRPIYWLQYALIYRAIGGDAFGFFLWNGLVFAVLVTELIQLIRRLAGSRFQAWLTGALFVVSGPVVENLYTLSKPELLQGALLLTALLVGTRDKAASGSRIGLVAGVFGQAALFLLAVATKETALLMLPIALAWSAAALICRRRLHEPGLLGKTFGIAVAAVIAALGYLALRGQYLPAQLTSGTYSNNLLFSTPRLFDSAIRWAGWMVRDFAFLAPLAILLLVKAYRRHLPTVALIFSALAWTGAWIAIYLPWEFTVEYYMLPVAIGVSVLAAALSVAALRMVGRDGSTRRGWGRGAIGLASLLWLTTLPNLLSNARQQLAVDEANTELIDFIASELPPGSLLVLNIQQANEYTYEIELHLRELRGRSDLDLRLFDPPSPVEAVAGKDTYVFSPFVENQPLLAVRMGIIEMTQVEWNLSLRQALRDRLKSAFRVERGFRLAIIDLPRMLCPLLQGRGYCQDQRPYLDTRIFSYGWEVDRLIESSKP